MKIIVTFFALLITAIGFSQMSNLEGKVSGSDVRITDFKISVTVDSADEIESTFTVKDFKEVLKDVDKDEDLSFEIICKNPEAPNDKQKTLTYKVGGNSNDVNGFLKSVKKIRKAAIKYYKNK